MLEHMVKSAVIFSDENKEEEKPMRSRKADSIRLSRDEYRQIIKDAYHEGREDALKEQQKQAPPKQEKNSLKSEKKVTKKSAKENEEENRQRLKSITVPLEEKEAVELEGKEEAIKLHAKEKEENMQRFKTITARQDIELFRAETVFPFTLFKSTLVIDTTKITLASKQMFATENVTTIPLKDLSDVTVQTVAFLGTLDIKYMPQSSSYGMNKPVITRIPNLKREDAIRAKNILKGALVAKAEEIDIAKLSPEEIKEVLHKFGESEGVL